MICGDESIVIVSASRTAVGLFCGALSKIPANDLGAILIKEVAKTPNVDLNEIDEVILVQMHSAG